ncbi:MAG: hypothetical protein JJU36_14985 [Phycisphaeraceae bacterium]|nr:hypothetical protein [Phycisphaeraceae bacterium]
MVSSNSSLLVITAVGPDRPGLVDELTGFLHEAGVNIADSRMANLAGQFSLLLLIQAGADQIARLRGELPERASGLGLMLMMGDPMSPRTTTAGLPYRVEVRGMDQAGIVHRISHLLSSQGVNIEEVETKLEQRSYDQPPVFSMVMELTVPSSVKVSDLRRQLLELCDTLNMDGRMEPR